MDFDSEGTRCLLWDPSEAVLVICQVSSDSRRRGASITSGRYFTARITTMRSSSFFTPVLSFSAAHVMCIRQCALIVRLILGFLDSSAVDR